MTRGSKVPPSGNTGEVVPPPLKQPGEKKMRVATISKEEAHKPEEPEIPDDASGLYILDWTLGQFATGSDEYQTALNALAPEDSGVIFDRAHFLSLIGLSMSLSQQGKRRVLGELSKGLTQFQIDELIDNFESERQSFEKLFATEERELLPIYFEAVFDWSTILVGGLSTVVMRKVVEDALCDAGKFIPRIFTRDSNFWMVVADFVTVWGLDQSILSRTVARGIAASMAEGGAGIFQLDLIDYAYRTNNLYFTTSPRAYIQRRVEWLRVSALDTLPKITPKISVSRVLLLGFAEDYIHLGQRKNAEDAVASAKLILKLIPESDRTGGPEYKHAEALLAAAELTLEAYRNDFDIGKISSYLKKIFECQEPRITATQIISALLLAQQGDLCSALLEKRLERETDPNVVIDTAVDLLVLAKITANLKAYGRARSCLYENLKSCFQEPVSKRSRRNLRRRYIETMIFVWLVGGNEGEEILNLWRAAAGDDYHMTMDSSYGDEAKRDRDWPGVNVNYLFIRALEQHAIGGGYDTGALLSSIREYWNAHYLLIVLFALSSNEGLRAPCRAIAESLVWSCEHRMFGLPLGKKLQFFQSFAEGENYAGSSEEETRQWRGQLVYEDLFS